MYKYVYIRILTCTCTHMFTHTNTHTHIYTAPLNLHIHIYEYTKLLISCLKQHSMLRHIVHSEMYSSILQAWCLNPFLLWVIKCPTLQAQLDLTKHRKLRRVSVSKVLHYKYLYSNLRLISKEYMLCMFSFLYVNSSLLVEW